MSNQKCPKCNESGEIGPFRSLGGSQSFGVLCRYRIVLCNRCYCSVTNKKRVLLAEENQKGDIGLQIGMHVFLRRAIETICKSPLHYTVIVTDTPISPYENSLHKYEAHFDNSQIQKAKYKPKQSSEKVYDSPMYKFFNLLQEAEVEYIASQANLVAVELSQAE